MFKPSNRHAMVKALRVLKGARQIDMAKRIGRSQTWWSFIESAQLRPTPMDARRISKLLGSSVETLFPDGFYDRKKNDNH